MSSTVDNVLNGVELTERVAGDIAHTTPVLKFFIKRTSAAKLRDLVDQVQQHLNEAGNILKDRESKEALYEVGIYQELFDELALYVIPGSHLTDLILMRNVTTQEKLDAAGS